MSSLFKNYDPYLARIKKSQEKIAENPEIRGLLLPKNPLALEDKESLILSEEELLLQKLEEIRLKKHEIEREKKLRDEEERKRKPEILKFRSYNRGLISFDLEHKNPTVIELLTKHKGYFNNSYGATINEETFFQFHAELIEKLPTSKLINFEPVFDPFWKIKKQEKQIVVQWNPITNDGGYYKRLEKEDESLTLIPGVEKRLKYYTIPFSEGWRLYLIHPEVETRLCKWENEELIREVETEFKKRLRVKTIHNAEDSDVDFIFSHFPEFKNRPHQRVALEFEELVDGKSLIAYGTGTGKTAIGIAAAMKRESKRTLIICPGALRANWKKHIKNHTGEEPIILAGRAPIKADYQYLLFKHPKWVIINYEILRTAKKEEGKNDGDIFADNITYPWVDLLNLYHPEYIIIDESHYIKNPSAHQSKAVRLTGNANTKKMALSGTPIMNRSGELWSVLNWLHPEQFTHYETFLNQYGYGRHIQTFDAQKLRSLLETIMLKRTRQDISKNLPPVNRIVETFEMGDRARKIYDKILMGIYEELAEFDSRGIGGVIRTFKSILPKINAMIKVCAADKVENTINRAVEIADAIEEEQWNGILIFTHFKGTCNTIARKLGNEALSFVERTNNGFTTIPMEERMRVVDQFQNDPTKRFLVATEGSAREGLDITKASVLIFNDLFWTPAAHLQCEGRAFYRESDMHGGDSMYFTFEDSIEEWIVELQGIKQNTIDLVVEGKGIEESITNKIIERLRDAFQKKVRGE
jgi:SNF2 family DNA or RNA helicase